MSDLENLLERNAQFAARYEGGLSMLPRFSTIVLTCADARLDPAFFLGLKLGDAYVMCNFGARVTKEVELELGIIWTIAGRISGDEFQGFELAIIQHTNCGFERFVDEELQQALSDNLGLEKADFAALSNADHSEAICKDIEDLRKSSLVPKEMIVSGYVYDVTDGTLREVAAPEALGGSRP